ncbi:DgyrCDS1195 [Dimorphilus gyrociliatus]|uniref:DgyrCDS1195 n=1 Tax=Dimorphilus gyrociliatus TaxID=2664684 RepID=A0A7I8V8D4_9ANNE|nr:DgyrCDS1195 [Dimorphilus gyrociliatus]
MRRSNMQESKYLVCKSWEKTKEVLHLNSEVIGVSKLLDLAQKAFGNKPTISSLSHPFFVIEGLDGTGKSTVVKGLCKDLNATGAQTPPPNLLEIRSTFDKLDTQLKRAYYSTGNYLTAHYLQQLCQERVVVMDRFWHSTAAYTISETCFSKQEELPEPGDEIYNWPEDLLKPTAVIFLKVSEEERLRRIYSRDGDNITVEESQISKNSLFRNMIAESYRRMSNPGVIEVDANGSQEEVTARVVQALKTFI